jgi:hypothetical protein
MAQRIIAENAQVTSVTYALPNKHYIPVDMKYIDVDNTTPLSFFLFFVSILLWFAFRSDCIRSAGIFARSIPLVCMNVAGRPAALIRSILANLSALYDPNSLTDLSIFAGQRQKYSCLLRLPGKLKTYRVVYEIVDNSRSGLITATVSRV